MSETAPVSLDALVASRRDQLERISDAGLMAQGRVFLLSLEAIKTEFGSRWPLRTDVVWDAVERALARNLPAPDVFVRIDDTSVLVAVASASAYEGQVRCVEILRSLSSYFLGRAVDDDIGIHRVSAFAQGALETEAVDLTPIASEALVSRDEARPSRHPDDWRPPLTERRASGTVALSHYGETAFALDVVPVWRLDQATVSAYAIRLTLAEGVDRLSDLDHEALSHLTIGHLLPILEDYRKEGGAFAIVTPLAFSVLSARRPRLAILARCARLRDVMRSAVIIEISYLHAGVPPGLIREVVSMVRPFVRVVETILRVARRRTSNLMVHGVPGEASAAFLRRQQASHVTYSATARL